MTDVTDKLIIESEVKFADQSNAALKGLEGTLQDIVVVSDSAEKSTASLENRFQSLERRFATTQGQASQYEKIQSQVNLAVGQNPALQERANAVLEAAALKFSGASQELTALDKIGAIVESRMLGLGNSLGLIGQVFQVVGVGGLAAAVGVGAVAVAFSYASEQANKFGEAAISVNKVSQATGLTTTEVRGLSEAAEKVGVSGDEITSSFERLTANLASARDGTGTLFKSLEQVDGGLAVNVASAKSGAAAWDLIAKAINSTNDATTRAAIARAAFGRGGVQDVPVLTATDQAGGIVAYSEELQKATGITNELTASTSKLKSEADALNNQTKLIIGSLSSQLLLQTQLNAAQAQNNLVRSIANPGASNAALTGFTGALDLGANFSAADQAKAAAPSSSGNSDAITAQADATKNLTAATTALSAAQANADKAQQSYDSETVSLTATTKTLTDIRHNAGDALLLLSNLEKQHITGLNGAATGEEILKAKTDALTASFLQGKISAEDYNRALHGDTANAIAALQDQRTVIEAVGGAMKMAAQYAADYQTQLRAGKDPADALQIASEKLANSQAGANASSEATTFSLQNNLAVAQAWTTADQMKAQAQATYNQLIHDGVSAEQAGAQAAAQYADSKAKAEASAQKTVQSSQDNLDLLKAAGTADEARLKSDIAYRDAMAAGATSAQAAAISANTFAAASIQAANAAQQTADAWEKAQRAVLDAARAAGSFAPEFGGGAGDGTFSSQFGTVSAGTTPMVSGGGETFFSKLTDQQIALGPEGAAQAALPGGVSAAITAAEKFPTWLGGGSMNAAPATDFTSRILTTVTDLYSLLNSQTADKNKQLTNDQQFMAWLETQPATIANLKAIATLNSSMQSLTGATNANTAAISATLNPIYSQGHSALAIGYYTAASGLDMIASGPTSGDQVPFHAMINGGERIQITPAGQSSNDNRSVTQQTNITQIFNLPADSSSNRRRTATQFAEGFRRGVAAG